MDDADRAQPLEEAHLDRAPARQRDRRRERSKFCRGCGVEIPAARLAAVDTSDCIDCARESERCRGVAA